MKYTAPLTDLRFALHDVLDASAQFAALMGEGAPDRELIDAVLEEGAKFCEQVIAPLNAVGDAEGCQFDKTTHAVKTPTGFADAYRQYREGGWTGLTGPTAYGGQGMPETIGAAMKEMIESSNLAWGTYPLLSAGAIDALWHHGEDWQKDIFLTRLIDGTWTGTMCLTEPHCGSDLGLLKTRAEPVGDGSYRVYGTKIFITAGDNDLADNIVHLVLARLPDAPAGTRGISMFIVPKFAVARDGTVGGRNPVFAGSIEHKMGIKGSATCVMNFDGAVGYLIGKEHRGLNAMFTMMNSARLGVGIQGLGLIETSFQNAAAYARDRLQMRALSGAKRPEKPADPLTVHPDVRRMLMTQRAIAESGRLLCLYNGLQVDRVNLLTDPAERAAADALCSFLTPITKGLMTELAIECTSHGVQVLGGHGYIAEWGMEQLLRDSRITTIYEGTTQIQAIDLLGRKVLGTNGVGLNLFLTEIRSFLDANEGRSTLVPFVGELRRLTDEWQTATLEISLRAKSDPEELGAAAVDYLFYAGYITLAYFWVRSLDAVTRESFSGTARFRDEKLALARFYFDRILPRTQQHLATIRAGASSLMQAPDSLFEAA